MKRRRRSAVTRRMGRPRALVPPRRRDLHHVEGLGDLDSAASEQYRAAPGQVDGGLEAVGLDEPGLRHAPPQAESGLAAGAAARRRHGPPTGRPPGALGRPLGQRHRVGPGTRSRPGIRCAGSRTPACSTNVNGSGRRPIGAGARRWPRGQLLPVRGTPAPPRATHPQREHDEPAPASHDRQALEQAGHGPWQDAARPQRVRRDRQDEHDRDQRPGQRRVRCPAAGEEARAEAAAQHERVPCAVCCAAGTPGG